MHSQIRKVDRNLNDLHQNSIVHLHFKNNRPFLVFQIYEKSFLFSNGFVCLFCFGLLWAKALRCHRIPLESALSTFSEDNNQSSSILKTINVNSVRLNSKLWIVHNHFTGKTYSTIFSSEIVFYIFIYFFFFSLLKYYTLYEQQSSFCAKKEEKLNQEFYDVNKKKKDNKTAQFLRKFEKRCGCWCDAEESGCE